MVQIHEAPQSFGSGLIQALSGAGVNVAEGLQKRNAATALDKLLKNAEKTTEKAPLGSSKEEPLENSKPRVNTGAIYNQAIAAGQSPEQAKMTVQPYIEKEKIKAQEESKLRIEKEKSLIAEKKANAKRERSVREASKGVEEVEKLIGKKGIGFLSHYTSTSDEAFKNSAKLRTATAPMYHFFKEELFPGRFTDADLKFVTDTYIPQPGDREATLKGKVEAFKDLVNNVQKGQVDPNIIQDAASTLTPQIVNSILEEAGGDPAKATELAKERGYKW